MLQPKNLLNSINSDTEERTFTLLRQNSFSFETIISNGASSPADFWYEQENPEWVCLIKGTATLEFENYHLDLKTGDSLTIPAKLKHRVKRTSSDAVWLALHFLPEEKGFLQTKVKS